MAIEARRYKSMVHSINGRRELANDGRRITIRTEKVGARDITIFEDLPAASKWPAVPVSAITIGAR